MVFHNLQIIKACITEFSFSSLHSLKVKYLHFIDGTKLVFDPVSDSVDELLLGVYLCGLRFGLFLVRLAELFLDNPPCAPDLAGISK